MQRTLRRSSTTRTSFSTRVELISRPVNGANVISLSSGYCESHDRSAPRSIIPIWISMTVAGLFDLFLERAYSIATSRFAVVDMKANSTPPCPCPFQNWRGSTEPERPR